MIAGVELRFRPISTWPGDLSQSRRSALFKVDHDKNLRALKYELGRLEADNVVIELAYTEEDFRIDGTPRVRAVVAHPGVVVSFESKYGPLRYATDVFDEWKHNLRAIALALEDLRRVERYGIVKRGEQYAGWRQIEARSQSSEDARDWLRAYVMKHSGARLGEVEGLTDRALVRTAKRYAHPDVGGSVETFAAVQQAAGTLGLS
jgi:hypothetical protein